MPALVKALKDQGAEGIVVFVGGVIPARDYDFLYKAGVPGSSAQHPISACAKQVLAAIKAALSTREPSRTSLTGWLIR